MTLSIRHNRRAIILFALVIAGEVIFFLPFVLARIFRPTLLEYFNITNTELGTWFSVYGVVAMAAYLAGGSLADRFSARKLMALALWLTSLGGLLMAAHPSNHLMIWIYAFWGFTTICLFWAAMIRATRIWGGTGFQGRAFGWLEGGRGAIAALLGSMALLLFSQIGEFTWVILASSILTFLADRFSRVHVIVVSFGLTLWGGLMIGLGLLDSILGLVLMNLTLTAAGIYGVRALYFAVLEEAGVPLALTGIAVGIVSFAGFTPEIFVSPLMGYLLDRNPGTVGHQHVFLLLVIFAGVGLGTSLIFNIFTNKHKSEAQNENEDSE